jgi:hypothetical protein
MEDWSVRFPKIVKVPKELTDIEDPGATVILLKVTAVLKTNCGDGGKAETTRLEVGRLGTAENIGFNPAGAQLDCVLKVLLVVPNQVASSLVICTLSILVFDGPFAGAPENVTLKYICDALFKEDTCVRSMVLVSNVLLIVVIAVMGVKFIPSVL